MYTHIHIKWLKENLAEVELATLNLNKLNACSNFVLDFGQVFQYHGTSKLPYCPLSMNVSLCTVRINVCIHTDQGNVKSPISRRYENPLNLVVF